LNVTDPDKAAPDAFGAVLLADVDGGVDEVEAELSP
jgi:hypothetical protein